LQTVIILVVLVSLAYTTMETSASPIGTAQDLGMAAELSSPVETSVISHDLDLAEHKKKKYRGKIFQHSLP
jgi:hypothetical protein